MLHYIIAQEGLPILRNLKRDGAHGVHLPVFEPSPDLARRLICALVPFANELHEASLELHKKHHSWVERRRFTSNEEEEWRHDYSDADGNDEEGNQDMHGDNGAV